MAFCNSCGANLTDGSRFCNKCGKPILSSTPGPAIPTTSAQVAAASAPGTVPVTNPPHGGGALKVILVAVGVIIVLGAIGIASVTFFALRMAKHTRVHQNGNDVKVETPFGNVETSKDPDEAAHIIGVDLYPGAELVKDGSAASNIGSLHTAAVNAESKDSVEKVSEFYKEKFPRAQVTSSDSNRCTIVTNEHNSVTTINIEGEGDITKIMIATVTHH